jgi:hypothetical protein
MKTPAESITVLQHFGYSEREAKFLYLVATHSGVFLQRQYRPLGLSRGACRKLALRTIVKKDAKEHLPKRGVIKVYELFGQGIYGALGTEKFRRLIASPDSAIDRVAAKLLALDFVLANPDLHYLDQEADKVSYFVTEQKISKEILPSRGWGRAEGAESIHYFSERFPIFLTAGSDERIVNFTYIEDENISLKAFASFVTKYRPLFCALGAKFRLIFVSRNTRSFHVAKKLFVKTLSVAKNGAKSRHLARFFWLRMMAEEKRFAELARQDLMDWQRGLKRYGGPLYEAQYQEWKQTGKLPLAKPAENSPAVPDPASQFDTFLSLPPFE